MFECEPDPPGAGHLESMLYRHVWCMTSSRKASLVSGRLLLGSLGTFGFHYPVTPPKSIWELMTVHTEGEKGLVTRQMWCQRE